MKKLLFLLFFLLAVPAAIAQPNQAKQKVRKVPFLPYAGMSVVYPAQTVYTAGGRRATYTQPFSRQPIRKSYETIFFEEDSAKIRDDQFGKLKRVANRLSREGSYFYSVIAFTSPEIDPSLAHARARTAIAAMEDFGIKAEPTVTTEHKAHPVLNPHRVEIHMRAHGLGTTIRK